MNGFLLIAEWEMKIKVRGKLLCFCSTDEVDSDFPLAQGQDSREGSVTSKLHFSSKTI